MLVYKYNKYTDINSLSFVFRRLWCAAAFSPAAAVYAAAVCAVGSANQRTRIISSTWTRRTSRQRLESKMQVRDFVLLDSHQLV